MHSHKRAVKYVAAAQGPVLLMAKLLPVLHPLTLLSKTGGEGGAEMAMDHFWVQREGGGGQIMPHPGPEHPTCPAAIELTQIHVDPLGN